MVIIITCLENVFIFFHHMINRRLADVLGVLPHIPYYRVYRPVLPSIPPYYRAYRRTAVGRSTRVSRGAYDRDRVSRTRTVACPRYSDIVLARRSCSTRGDASINRTAGVSVAVFLLSFSPRHTLRRYFNRTRSPSRLVLCYARRA